MTYHNSLPLGSQGRPRSEVLAEIIEQCGDDPASAPLRQVAEAEIHSTHEAHGTCRICQGPVHQYPFGWCHVRGDFSIGHGHHEPDPINVRCSCS